MANSFELHVVSAESEIYAGHAIRLFATASLGEIEITPGHAPLLTQLVPGFIRIRVSSEKEDVVYVTGGILEIQPSMVIVLADTVVRAEELNEAEAIKAQKAAQEMLSNKQAKIDYAQVRSELAHAAARLKAIRQARNKGKLSAY